MANGEGEQGKAKSAWADLLSGAGRQLIPVLLTAGSLVGFVAFAGGVIVWTRFSAAKVPPDQAVNAVPRDELVAIGSSLLLLFGFFGILALIGALLVDRGGRATPGMARTLLIAFLIEGATTIVVAEGISAERTVAIAALFALPLAAAFWATWLESFVDFVDDLPTRPRERPGPRGYGMFLLPEPPIRERPERPESVTRLRWLWRRFRLWIKPWIEGSARSRVPAPFAMALAGVIGGAVLVRCDHVVWALIWLGLAATALAALALWRLHQTGFEVRERLEQQRRSIAGQRQKELEAEEEWGSHGRGEEEARMLNERPLRLELKLNGVMTMILALVVAVAVPSALLDRLWVAISIGAAAALTAALWRIAMLSVTRIVWFGIAVFLSVPLFGTLTAMARNIDDPQVQPMALIRTTDGPDEAIQGLYVTEADDRVYFASVATEGCTEELTAHSGRLEWVPKSEVVAMSVGPLQDVDDAADSALEMAYALTPAVETPAGGDSALTVGEATSAASEGAGAAAPEKRLEDAGPAVRPNYGAGLSLTPENASPGDRVTLRMSAPNEDEEVRGFGRTRDGHTVRVGGVRADVLKEYAHSPDTAEFVETLEGVLLRLEKDEPYVRGEDEFVRVEELGAVAETETLFVKLIDPRVQSVGGRTLGQDEGEGSRPGVFLPLAEDEQGRPVLADPEKRVQLKGSVDASGDRGEPLETELARRPKAQAWHERQIRFVVPENVSTGAVTVECSQLAGQPLLRVAHAPEARLTVHMQAGSSRVTFNSRGSSDADGEEISRRWNVAGLRRGDREKLTVDLPPRPRPYTVRMAATDESGRVDTTELRLLRLPASLFAFDRARIRNHEVLDEARKTLAAIARVQPPAAIEIDGHADEPGSARHNVRLSLRRAVNVRRELLGPPREGETIPVRTLAYGEGCPVDRGPGRNPRNRRVDVFVIDRGVRVDPARGCHARRFQSTNWTAPAPADG